ncbi:hypothetical protein P3S67_023448 [Capsicum chacoense]
MRILGHETLVVLYNHNFLAQLISEGMEISIEHFVNHLWLANILEPLAKPVMPAFIHIMQTYWNLPNRLPNM